MDPMVMELLYGQMKDVDDPKRARKIMTQSELVPFHNINQAMNGWKMFNQLKDREDPRPVVAKEKPNV